MTSVFGPGLLNVGVGFGALGDRARSTPDGQMARLQPGSSERGALSDVWGGQGDGEIEAASQGRIEGTREVRRGDDEAEGGLMIELLQHRTQDSV